MDWFSKRDCIEVVINISITLLCFLAALKMTKKCPHCGKPKSDK